MYETIIATLRDMSKMGMKYGMAVVKMQEAADAIEELSRENKEIMFRANQLEAMNDALIGETGATDALIVASKTRWIPVTERLPEAERKSYWVCTDTGYQCECRWTNNRFEIGELDEWGWSIFDIPQYQKVVAWMPLPKPYEPPKEET